MFGGGAEVGSRPRDARCVGVNGMSVRLSLGLMAGAIANAML